jgi:hypothetical protein
MHKLILPILTVVLAGCGQASNSASNAPKPGAAEAPAVTLQVVTGDERKKIVKALTAGLSEERDKMERVSFYSAKDIPFLDSSLDPYLSVHDTGLPILRMKATYFGSTWVFYDKVKIMADDVVVYDREFEHGRVHHNNSGGSVWETADFVAGAPEITALKLVANSKNATIRFAGSERREDHEITDKERKGIRSIVDAYEKLTSQLQR